MTRLEAALLVTILVLACTPELEPIHWPALDIEGLREAIANPTGVVDEASTNEIADEIVNDGRARQLLSEFIHEVFVEAQDSDAGPIWVAPRALAGTSVYVLVACPGPELVDEDGFAHGFMRVDSPILDAELISTFEIRGQLLLSFSACQIGDLVFEGSARAHHDLEAREVAFDPDIEHVELGRDGHTGELDEPVLWTGTDWISALFELESHDTLVLEWRPKTTELRLRGRTGALVCEVVDDELSCVPP